MKRFVTAAAVIAALSTVAMAADLSEGTKELSLSGYYDVDSALGDEGVLNVGLGLFVMDNLEVGAAIGVRDNDEVTAFSAEGFAEYNFPLTVEEWVPYVRGSVGYQDVDVDEVGSDGAVVFGGAAGIKYFVTPDLAIATEGLFQYATDDVFSEDSMEMTDTDFRVNLGLRYYFGRTDGAAR